MSTIKTWQELKALSNGQWPDEECMKEEIAQLRAALAEHKLRVNHVEQFKRMAQSRKDPNAFQALLDKGQPL